MGKRILIIGSGLSGRGMLGEMASRENFRIVFADKDKALTDGLKKAGFYTVKMTNLKQGVSRETRVDHFEVLNTVEDHSAYMQEIGRTDFALTALRPESFDEAIKDLAEGIACRAEIQNPAPLFITLGANYVGLLEYYREGLEKAVPSQAKDYYHRNVHLIMSIVNRKSRAPETADPHDPFRVEGDDKPVLMVEDDQALAECRYRPEFFQLKHNLSAAMAVKIWSGNVVQCTMAFAALHQGMTSSYEAACDPLSSMIAYYAADESYRAVSAEYGLPERSEKEKKRPVGIFRSREFHDSLYRIARDPIRKLGYNERFIGPARLCIRHGILPYFICLGAAYGFLYRNPDEPQCVELEKAVREMGIEKAILWFCGLDPSKNDERIIYELIRDHYRILAKDNPMDKGGNHD